MQTLLSVRNVRKIYGQGPSRVVALDKVSLEVPPGQVTLILGPSGSGKTTLLSILGCLLRPTSGQVLAKGSDVSRLSDAELSRLRREQIGFVFQSFNLLNFLTTRQNVEVALNLCGSGGAAARARAIELLCLVGLDHRLDFSPADLSGGERQRVAIARALANDPALLLADEPTGNLDSGTGRRVVDLLAGLAHDRCRGVVIVTHDTRILDVADRVLYLADGTLSSPPSGWHARCGKESLAWPVLPGTVHPEGARPSATDISRHRLAALQGSQSARPTLSTETDT